MDDGEKELAIRNYNKSLESNKKNTDAVEKLKQLSAIRKLFANRKTW